MEGLKFFPPPSDVPYAVLYCPEGWVRYGITDKIERGGKYALFSSSTIELKYNLINEEEGYIFSCSLGGGYRKTQSSTGESSFVGGERVEDRRIETKMSDVFVPFYISRDLDENKLFTIYCSRGYLYRKTEIKEFDKILNRPGQEETYRSHMVSLGGGMSLNVGENPTVHFMAEYNHLFGLEKKENQQGQLSLGLGLRFK
jgi:hypothetical protein